MREGAARATLAAAVALSELFTPLKVVVGCLQKIVELADVSNIRSTRPHDLPSVLVFIYVLEIWRK